jgi:hypothetical protein
MAGKGRLIGMWTEELSGSDLLKMFFCFVTFEKSFLIG